MVDEAWQAEGTDPVALERINGADDFKECDGLWRSLEVEAAGGSSSRADDPGPGEEAEHLGQIAERQDMLAGMDPKIPTSEYREIEALIASDESPVGIDAKKTHIIIIQKLVQIEARLERLEGLIDGQKT